MKKIGKRVYLKVSVLKKLVMRSMKKTSSPRKTKRRCWSMGSRKAGFGNVMGYSFENPANFGYNQEVKQYPQTLSQSSMVANENTNISRPDGMGLSSDQLPVNGVYRNFFGQEVPTQVPARWNFMGQPDGTLFPVGAPFQRYTNIGRRRKTTRRRRYNVPGSPCNKLRKRVCSSNPNCTYTKRGCRRRNTKKVYEGPSLASFGLHRSGFR